MPQTSKLSLEQTGKQTGEVAKIEKGSGSTAATTEGSKTLRTLIPELILMAKGLMQGWIHSEGWF